jgi:hypothetical protein
MVKYAKAKQGEPMEYEEYQQVRYGMALWMLQENAGLSYKEARVFLAEERYESTEHLAKALNMTKQGIYNLASSAREKMEKIEDIDAVFKGYFPLIVDVNPKGKERIPHF